MAEDEAKLVRLDNRAGAIDTNVGSDLAVDHAPYDWYDLTCPCGLPPGDCKEHPRAGQPAAARR